MSEMRVVMVEALFCVGFLLFAGAWLGLVISRHFLWKEEIDYYYKNLEVK